MQQAIFKDVWPELTPIIAKAIIDGLYEALGIPRPA